MKMIKDYFTSMYESTELIIIDDNQPGAVELFRGKKKNLPLEYHDKNVVCDLGVMENNKWYFWI